MTSSPDLLVAEPERTGVGSSGCDAPDPDVAIAHGIAGMALGWPISPIGWSRTWRNRGPATGPRAGRRRLSSALASRTAAPRRCRAGAPGAGAPTARLNLTIVVDHHAVQEDGDERVPNEAVAVVSRRQIGDVERLPFAGRPRRIGQRWPLVVDGRDIAVCVGLVVVVVEDLNLAATDA